MDLILLFGQHVGWGALELVALLSVVLLSDAISKHDHLFGCFVHHLPLTFKLLYTLLGGHFQVI